MTNLEFIKKQRAWLFGKRSIEPDILREALDRLEAAQPAEDGLSFNLSKQVGEYGIACRIRKDDHFISITSEKSLTEQLVAWLNERVNSALCHAPKVNEASVPAPQTSAETPSVAEFSVAKICPDCEGCGHLGRAHDGRYISCEMCGGHEDALGEGIIRATLSEPRIAEQELRKALEYILKVGVCNCLGGEIKDHAKWCDHVRLESVIQSAEADKAPKTSKEGKK